MEMWVVDHREVKEAGVGERMRGINRITCLWPGLARLWFHADAAGLCHAVAFAALLNVLLWGTFITDRPVPAAVIAAGWAVASGYWLVALIATVRHRWYDRHRHNRPVRQDLFIQAQTEYLKGRWTQAIDLLQQLLGSDPADVESRLLLATVLRRTKRWDLAHQQLLELERLDGAERWRQEVARERQILERKVKQSP